MPQRLRISVDNLSEQRFYLLCKRHPGRCLPRTSDRNEQTYRQNPGNLIPERKTHFAPRGKSGEKTLPASACSVNKLGRTTNTDGQGSGQQEPSPRPT
jgi:hypothetical protein